MPMMDFFQQRVKALERELAAERERADAASSLLTQQEALKNEVESHLKGLTDQIRREKAERDGEEAKSHARGRVEALERRLDEMNATFAQLLKEAVARQAPSAAIVPVEALGAELAVFRRTIKDVAEQVARWRDEMKDLPELLPEVRSVAASIPEGERRFSDLITARLDEFTSRLQGTLADWERRHDLELRRQDDRLQSLVDERAALAKMWERQGHEIRQEFLQERIARETAIGDQVAELAKRIDAVDASQREAGAGSASVREALHQVLRVVTATPKAKDEIIAAVEEEKAELVRSMRERREQTQDLLAERSAIEKSMGNSLIAMTAELEKERGRTREAETRLEQAKGLTPRIIDLERSLCERDARALSLGAERDELTRALVVESDKTRAAIAERTACDERWHQRLLELQRKVEEETARAVGEASTTSDLRAKVATLSEHMARALQERDAVIGRFADWERERQRLFEALKQKDGMIAMLSTAFQSSLKKL
jgi:chromosome segregation ATPase